MKPTDLSPEAALAELRAAALALCRRYAQELLDERSATPTPEYDAEYFAVLQLVE